MEGERVLFRGEVEDPEDVDDGEDEPAGAHSFQGARVGEDALVSANDGEDEGNGAEDGYLVPVHAY